MFGARRWFADPYALIADPAIDLVTVAVKVPAHRDLVLAALAAGKAVYSEPIASGRIGRILSARVHATTSAYSPESTSNYDYFNKRDSGASFLTITAAHVLDIVEAVLGPISEIDARTELLWPEVALVDTGETSQRDIVDHADIIAKTASGASASIQVLAGVPVSDARFLLEVRGSGGWLVLEGKHPAGVQVGDIALAASVDFATPETPAASGTGPTAAEFWNGASINVGEVYASLARDIVHGTYETPGFEHALHNSRLIERVERAADSGQRQ